MVGAIFLSRTRPVPNSTDTAGFRLFRRAVDRDHETGARILVQRLCFRNELPANVFDDRKGIRGAGCIARPVTSSIASSRNLRGKIRHVAAVRR
jgi:hypothetical protein